MLHLGNRVILQNDDGLAVLFGLLQAFRLATVVVLDRDDCVSIMLVVGDDNRNTQLAGRFRQAVATHPERVNAQRLENG